MNIRLPTNEVIICPICFSDLTESDDDFFCNNCRKKFPIINNVGVLVPSPDDHLSNIDEKMKGKTKDWYLGSHLKSYDEGPYKFHIKKRIKFLKKILNSHISKNGKFDNLLDLGCGDGANLRWLNQYGKNTWATDYNLLRLERTSQEMNNLGIQAKIYLSDIYSLPFRENSFDLIFFHHVIEHLRNDLDALQNIYKITKPGGTVIIGTPNEGVAAWKFAYSIEPDVKRKSDHVNFYTEKSISKLSEKAGFKIKHIEHIGWGVPIWKLDPVFRKHKIFDDMFESVGKRLFYKQATSLYVILEKD